MTKTADFTYKYEGKSVVRERLPEFYAFLNSKPEHHRLLKCVLGAAVGLALGFAFHFAIIYKMGLPAVLERLLSGSFLVAFTVGFSVSTQVRCILLLTLPTFCGKSGRTYIGALALAYLLLGPVTSIMFNAEEISRTLTCSLEMSHNMSRSRMNLKLQPLHHIMTDMRSQARKMHKMADQLKEAFQPAEFEVKDTSIVSSMRQKTQEVDRGDSKIDRAGKIDSRYKEKEESKREEERVEGAYEKKMDFSCEGVFNLAVDGCKAKFREAEKRCKKKLGPVAFAFCWPMKLTAICNLAKLVPQATGTNCNAADAVDEGFGEEFVTAEKSATEIEKELDVNIAYKLQNNPQELLKKTPEEIALTIRNEFTWRKRWLDFTLTIINTLLAFLFLNVLYRAFIYNKKFLSDVRHDNCYVTGYFQHIDRRRQALRKKSLLPLRKVEKKSLISPNSLKLTTEEKHKLGKGTSMLVMRVFFVGMVIFLDKMIYDILTIINKYSRVDYEQKGVHQIDLQVNGTGAMANLVRSLFKGLDQQNYTLNQDLSNVACLPDPTLTRPSLLWTVLCIYLCILVLLALEAYGLRLRRALSEFFFPKQEKRRTLFLYNSLLQKREGFLRHCEAMVKQRAKACRLEGEVSLLGKLVEMYPRYLRRLESFAKSRTRCLVCRERLGRQGVICTTQGCKFGYCMECWGDIRGVCYACRREEEWTDTGSGIW